MNLLHPVSHARTILCSLSLLYSAATITAQFFTNVASPQGLAVLPSGYFGNSVSFHDFDHDGWADITMAAPGDSIKLYRNVQGTLVPLPSPAATPGDAKHVLWVDFDNDGDDDLFITVHNGPLALYRNDGAAGFTDITTAAGLPTWVAPHFGASWGDFDLDGYLDVYVCCYHNGIGAGYEKLNHLYRNNGDGTFTDVTLAAGVDDGLKPSLQSLWFDHDMDGLPDLYVINDRTPNFNSLYRNNGDGTFTNIAAATGTTCPETDAMSATLGDPDNDGLLDLFITNNGTDILPERACRLLMRDAAGQYTDRAEEYGVDCSYFGWGAVWADVDNNGWPDLFVASEGITGAQLHLNDGTAPLQNGTPWLIDSPASTCYALASGDLDNDGHPDFILGSEFPDPPQLWHNAGLSGNQHVSFTLQGTISNAMAIGAWIAVHADGRTQLRYTTCGANYLGQDSQHHHFGLGAYALVDSVTVTYPSGHVDRYVELDAGVRHALTEGETYLVEVTASGPLAICAGGNVTLDAGEHHVVLWNTGDSTRFITVDQSGSYQPTITTVHGLQVEGPATSITVHPLPDVLAFTTAPSCTDSSNGSITLVDLAGQDAVTVTWDHGPTGTVLTGIGAGSYAYTMTTVHGCTASGTITVVSPPELVALVNSTPASDTADGSIDVQVFGGAPPYSLSLNGVPFTGTTVNAPAGMHVVMVVDANGCSVEQLIEVGTTTGTARMDNAPLRVYPIPASDELFGEGVPPGAQRYMLGLDGKVLQHHPAPPPRTIALHGLHNGVYLLRVLHGSTSWSAPVIVLR